MKGTTHIAVGLLAANIAVPELLQSFGHGRSFTYIPLVCATVAGSLLPDIDNPESTLGRFNIFAKFFKHRGFCHSLLFVTIMAAYFTEGFKVIDIYDKVFIIGMASHIILDMFNVQGVQLLWPIKKEIGVPFIAFYSGGIADVILGLASFIFVVYQFNTAMKFY